MAEYFIPTVLQPDIPVTDMTDLERLVLTSVFQSELRGDSLYLYAESAVYDLLNLEMAEVVAALAASEGVESRTNSLVREALAESPPGAAWLEVDLAGVISWEHVIQDVVRRSPTLEYLVAISAFTCSKMLPDGFGGMVLLITGDQRLGKSTDDMLAILLDQAEHGEVGAAPGFGAHVLLRLAEPEVRAEVVRMIGSDETSLRDIDVTAADIRAGCRFAVSRTDLEEEQGSAVYRAALAAIHEAEERQTPSA